MQPNHYSILLGTTAGPIGLGVLIGLYCIARTRIKGDPDGSLHARCFSTRRHRVRERQAQMRYSSGFSKALDLASEPMTSTSASSRHPLLLQTNGWLQLSRRLVSTAYPQVWTCLL